MQKKRIFKKINLTIDTEEKPVIRKYEVGIRSNSPVVYGKWLAFSWILSKNEEIKKSKHFNFSINNLNPIKYQIMWNK